MDLTVLKELYNRVVGVESESVTEMPSSGSNRRYFRLAGERTLIGVVGTCKEENEAFLYMDKHFRAKGLPVPEVYACSDDRMSYVQEDLGDTLLFNAIEKGRKTSVFSDEEKRLLAKTIRLLPDIQFAGADGMDFSYCYPASEFDSRSIMWDLNYFKYCFLKATGLEFLEDKFYNIEAFPPKAVVDATGCGDTYSTGYLYKRASGEGIYESGQFAAAMSTLKLEHSGPFNKTEADVYALIQKYQG